VGIRVSGAENKNARGDDPCVHCFFQAPGKNILNILFAFVLLRQYINDKFNDWHRFEQDKDHDTGRNI
jgi:hypothetical protein